MDCFFQGEDDVIRKVWNVLLAFHVVRIPPCLSEEQVKQNQGNKALHPPQKPTLSYVTQHRFPAKADEKGRTYPIGQKKQSFSLFFSENALPVSLCDDMGADGKSANKAHQQRKKKTKPSPNGEASQKAG